MELKKEDKKQEEASFKKYLDKEYFEKSIDEFRHRLGVSTNEQKKTDEKGELKKDTRSFNEITHQIGQKLITHLKKIQDSPDNEENYLNYLKFVKDITDNDLPQLNKKFNEDANQKIEELTDTLKRLQAEFDNFRKRIEKEKTEFVKYAHADVITNMLPVLDSFELALKNTTNTEKLIEGVKIIYAQFYSVLESEGLKQIHATGQKFDPYKHEVLMKEESEKPEDTVLEEFQKGYILNDRVIRHSKVKVSGK